MNHTTSSGTAATLAFLLATSACSTATTASAPHIGAQAASESSSPCRVTGGPVVLARRVFVPGGLETIAHDGGFEVRFASTKARCFAVDWPAAAGGRQVSPCPAPGARADIAAARDVDTTFAFHATVARTPSLLGVAMSEPSRPAREGRESLAARPGRAALGQRGEGEAAAVLVPFGGDRFLSVSIEGGLESHRLRARAIASSGEAVGSAFDLSPPDMSVIGGASAAVEPNGDGLVAYIASTGAEFDVLATPISCATR